MSNQFVKYDGIIILNTHQYYVIVIKCEIKFSPNGEKKKTNISAVSLLYSLL